MASAPAPRPPAREPPPPPFAQALLRAWPPAVLVILATLAFGGLLASGAGQILATNDIERYFHWVHEYIRAELFSGRIPLWNPYNYCGTPFVANPHTAVFYPFTWLCLIMPVIQAHKWMIFIHCCLAGGFMYLFLRRVGIGRVSALAGCLPWMFSGYFMAHGAKGHLTLLFNMAWLPLAVYCCERALQESRLRWLFACGFVLGIQLLAGEPQVCYYSSLLITIYVIVRTAAEAPPGASRWQPSRWGKRMGGLLVIAAVCAFTSAIQTIPTTEFALQSDRSANSYDFVTFMSFPPQSFIGFLLPWQSGLTGLRIGTGDSPDRINLNWEFAVYVGIVTLVLAGVSCLVRKRPVLLAARVVLVAAIILMLGRYTPIYPLLFRGLPGLRMFRMPAQAMVMAMWAIAVMSAFGFDYLFKEDSQSWRAGRWRIVALAGLSAAGLLLILGVSCIGVAKSLSLDGRSPTIQAARLGDPTFAVPLALLVITAGLLIAMKWLPRRAAAASVLVLLAADLLISRPAFPTRPYSFDADRHFQALLNLRKAAETHAQPFRADFAPSFNNPGAAMGARVECVNAYWGASLRRFFRYVHWMRRQEPDPVIRHLLPDRLYRNQDNFPLRALNIRYASELKPNTSPALVEKTDPEPRAWVVERTEVIVDEETILQRMRDPQFDPATTVILEGAPRIEMAPGDATIGTCRATKHDDGTLQVQTETSRDGYLVLSEVHYPGWRATVDGEEVAVEPADYVITALPLPAGKHEVKYYYDPLSFKLGAVGTAASCLFGTVLLILAWRKKPRQVPATRAP